MTGRLPSLSSVLLGGLDCDAERATALLEALRREDERTTDGATRARLQLFLGTLHERRRETREATRHFAAAWELASSSPGLLQALIGVTLRRNAIESLGSLLERLVERASSQDEKQQAYLLLSELRRRQGDAEGARATIEHWLAERPEDASAWLALDIVASQTAQIELRERARLGRAGTAHDPRLRAGLLLDAARMRAEANDQAALDLCRRAADELDSLSLLAVWERCALGLRRWAEASTVAERAGDLLRRALDDDELAQASEVPKWRKDAIHVALFGLRAAEWARRAGETDRAVTLFERGAEACPSELLPQLARLAIRKEAVHLPGLEPFLEERAEQMDSRRIAAGLWLDLAEMARRSGDMARVRRAAERALSAAPTSLRTWAVLLDVLEASSPAHEYAAALEAFAPHLETRRADGLLEAAIIASLAEPGSAGPDTSQIQRLVSAGVEAGADAVLAARLGAALAHRIGDGAAYETALSTLARQASAADRVDAALSLLRVRLLRSESSAAEAARATWDEITGPPFADHPLPATLRALVLPLWTGVRSADDSVAWEKVLARSTPSNPLLEGAKLMTLRRLLAADQRRAAILRLRSTLEATPGAPTAAAALADLLLDEDPEEAADVLVRAARGQSDPGLGGGWLLRAARLLWKRGKPAEALALAREAEPLAPRAARPWLVWGSRLHETDDLRQRARLLEEEGGDRGTFIELERLALSAYPADTSADETLESIPQSPDTNLESIPQAGPGEPPPRTVQWLRALLDAARSDTTEPLDRQTLDALPGAPRGLSQAFSYARLFERKESSPRELTARAADWANAAEGTEGTDAALAWLAASRKARSLQDEAEARRVLGSRLGAPELGCASVLLTWLTDPSAHRQHAEELDRLTQNTPVESPTGRALRWAQLELTPPGEDGAERAVALEGLASAKAYLDPENGGDASSVGTLLTLAGFDALAAGDAKKAASLFQRATELLPDDFAPWEGVRAAAARLEDAQTEASACVELARRSADDGRASAFWERAGVLYQDVLQDEQRAEEVFAAALARDFSREEAFRRLFLLVKGRSDRERLLELVEGRLSVVDERRQVSELLWEKARLTRALGDERVALRTLDQLLELVPDHLGALALVSELSLRNERYERAAVCLSRLVDHPEVPPEQRLLSGLAAADLYERKLLDPARAVRLLRALEDAGHGDDPALCERLALSALRDERWSDAAERFERSLELGVSGESRATAAAFLLALYRDRLPSRDRAIAAAHVLLEERPADADGLLFVLEELEPDAARPLARRALDHLRSEPPSAPLDPDRLHLVVLAARAVGWIRTELAACGALELLDRLGAAEALDLAAWRERSTRLPTVSSPALSPSDLDAIASPREEGPYLVVARCLAGGSVQGLEPSLEELGLGPEQLLSARTEADSRWTSLHEEVQRWLHWLGLALDVYVGGDEPAGVLALSGVRCLVIGPDWAPMPDGRGRAPLVASLFALARGSAPLVLGSEAEGAQLIAAAARVLGVRRIEDALAPTDGAGQELCERIEGALDHDARQQLAEALSALPDGREAFSLWHREARTSLLRAAVLTTGDPGAARDLVEAWRREGDASDQPVRHAIAFALSGEFADLRKRLGLEAP